MHLGQNTMKLQSKNHIVKLTEVNGSKAKLQLALDQAMHENMHEMDMVVLHIYLYLGFL